MFPVGHLSWGYILGKVTSNLINTECNLPFLFLISVTPDIDFLIPGLSHRTVTHSVIIYILFSLPFFMKYRKRALPYFVALCSHSFMDYLGAPTESLWPLHTHAFYPIINLALSVGITNLELAGFLASLLYLKTGDFTENLLKPQSLTLLLSIPAVEILGVSFFGSEFPYSSICALYSTSNLSNYFPCFVSNKFTCSSVS
jgi:hypothetical protein